MFSDALYMHQWCIDLHYAGVFMFFKIFTLLQTSVHDARLPSKFADYWQYNSRQADCSRNFIQTLEGWIHRFRGLLHKLYTCSISCLDKLELLLQNSFQLKKITVTYCNVFALYPYFNDVKGVDGLLCHLIGHIWTFPANLLLLTSGFLSGISGKNIAK